jgi:hypothetical protein
MIMRAVKIVITYDNDSVDLATGDAATQIMDWYNSCQTMMFVHGGEYRGPKFTTLAAEEVPNWWTITKIDKPT